MNAPTLRPLPADSIFVGGPGDPNKKKFCLMTAVAWIAGEKHYDMPECACPVIARFAIKVNDANWWKNDAERTSVLLPFAEKIIGTRGPKELTLRRAYFAADRAAREWAPRAMEAAKCGDLAERARAIPAIVDSATGTSAAAILRELRDELWNRKNAAAYAAYAAYAACDAAYAAYDAVYAACAAYDAYAAADAAYAAADAAYAAYAACAAYAAYAAYAAKAKRRLLAKAPLRASALEVLSQLCEMK